MGCLICLGDGPSPIGCVVEKEWELMSTSWFSLEKQGTRNEWNEFNDGVEVRKLFLDVLSFRCLLDALMEMSSNLEM